MLSSTLPELAGGGDRAAALRTLDSALQQKPGDSWLVIAQARVYMQLADFQRALALLDEALAGSTSPADRRTALYYRGHAHFDLGQYAQAADDFDATLAGRTTFRARLGPLLWRYAAQVRARRDARGLLAKEVGNENLERLARRRSPSSCWARCRPASSRSRPRPTRPPAAPTASAPASFFIGMDALRRGDKQRAREQLQLTQARCPTVSELNWAAASELKRL